MEWDFQKHPMSEPMAPHCGARALDDTLAPSAYTAQLTGPVGNRDLELTIMLNIFQLVWGYIF